MALRPVDAMVEDIDAQAAQLQQEFSSLISNLTALEHAAQSLYEREVQSLQQRIARNDETVQRLQGDNEAARIKIVRLRDEYEAATRKRKLELEATFGRTFDGTQRLDCVIGYPDDRTARPSTNTERGDASSPRRESSNRRRPRAPTDPTAAQRRQSTRHHKPPQQYSPVPDADQTAASAFPPKATSSSSNLGIGKRKRDSPNTSRPEQREEKRRDVAHSNGRGKGRQSKTTEFADVFQNGEAELKHKIVEHPKGSGNWFILRCDDHNVHFGYRAILSAMRHLSSKQLHGGLRQEASVAVQELGICVLNCDAARAKENNDVFAAALRDGYKVQKGISADDSGHRDLQAALRSQLENVSRTPHEPATDEDEPVPPASRRSLKTFDGITDPVVGELYLASWHPRGSPSSPDWYAVVVLPIDSFEKVGISGSISETRLTNYVPVCYESDRKTRTIIGWADDYKDGGPRATQRKFPVMYFDDDQTMPSKGDLPVPFPEFLDWLAASRLRAFGACGPDGSPARGYDTALSFKSRLREATSALSLRRDRAGSPADQTTGALPKEVESEIRADTDGSLSIRGCT
ncbi:hypothetical protein GE09DRAFT_1060412 [Coniochaeta sp. 2T2.1]|nr:hypothetical protein GE09DRAFT_1060412 [Coniochaeta sp. 2T2.1]